MNKLKDVLEKIIICIYLVIFGLATLFILVMMFITWGTEMFLYICPFGVLWISFFVSSKLLSDRLVKRIDIVDENIIFTTYKNKQLVYKMSDIEIVKTVYRKGSVGYIFVFNSGTKIETASKFEFYIEGYDNKYLFKDFFKVE